VLNFSGMQNKQREEDRQRTDERRAPERDSRGTKIDPAPGPGPKDAGKGAMGKEARDRLDRNH
jgi:hypothetical protein